ncbi:unnamed protein product [Lactuca saligna]|uniref:Cupin type-1 domain-containing protein n=1 Tax=Lactuca saligna TaxID=75948 RepID=A0AA35VAG7_LACSI|nr:unnamed protein product [Lactuca saligna]
MVTTSLSFRVVLSAYFLVILCVSFPNPTTPLHVGEGEEEGGGIPLPVPARHGAVVKKGERWSVVTTEFGEISAVKIGDGRDGFYHLQFITMEPNSLFLPVHLHSDMVFYVDSGSGTLNWVDLENDDDKLRQVELQAGDVYRLSTGSFFYLQSNLDPDRRKLRINAIFSDSKEEIREGSSFGAYASVRDLILGFDNRVLQAAFSVDVEVIEELRSGGKQPMIVHGVTQEKANELWEVHYRIMRAFLGRMKNNMIDININNNNKKDKAYNILSADHDVDNCNGWSLVVTSKQLKALKDSDFSIFMVNLTKGAMMAPHWNPTTAEIGVVVRGRGMVNVVCPGSLNETECKNSRFRVEEGDVFVVPRYHPMAQMSFNNGSFVFMGFTTTTKKNHPQYLVGTASVLQVLDKSVVAASFGVSNMTMDEVLKGQREAIIVECTSCAEEEERLMEEEIQREKEEERKKEEEEKAREEEEAREKEEEEAKRREEEEEAKRQEEEERREQEEARKREEEEAKRRGRRKRRPNGGRRRKGGSKRKHGRGRRKRLGGKRRRQGNNKRRRLGGDKRRRKPLGGRRRRRPQGVRKRRLGGDRRKRRLGGDRKRRRPLGVRKRRLGGERRSKRLRNNRRRRLGGGKKTRRLDNKEKARKQKEEEAARRQEEEAARRHQQQEEEARRRQQEEEARRREEEETGRGGGGGHGGGGEGEAASREEEEMARRQREAEAAARGGGGGGQENGSYEE